MSVLPLFAVLLSSASPPTPAPQSIEAAQTSILRFVDSLGEASAKDLFGPGFSSRKLASALDRAAFRIEIVALPPTNREYRNCATTEPGRKVWINGACWNGLDEDRREQLLVHEFLLFAGISDADYRISAIVWAARSRPAAEILRSLSVLPDLRSWNSSVTFFSSAAKNVNIGEGGSTGVKGGGDSEELSLKVKLVTAAFGAELDGQLRFENEAHRREFWKSVLTLDLVSVGSRSIPGSDRTDPSWAVVWKDIVTQDLKKAGIPAEGTALEISEKEAERMLLRAFSVIALSRSKASR